LNKRKIIAVSGSNGNDRNLDERILEKAERTGFLIAERGGILVCGGLGGVMEASARGAKKAGGITVGILPWKKEAANPYIDIPLATNLGFYRNTLIANCADCMIAICGRWGTLNEISMSVSINKPTVVITGTAGVSDILSGKDLLRKMRKKPLFVKTPEEAVEAAFSF